MPFLRRTTDQQPSTADAPADTDTQQEEVQKPDPLEGVTIKTEPILQLDRVFSELNQSFEESRQNYSAQETASSRLCDLLDRYKGAYVKITNLKPSLTGKNTPTSRDVVGVLCKYDSNRIEFNLGATSDGLSANNEYHDWQDYKPADDTRFYVVKKLYPEDLEEVVEVRTLINTITSCATKSVALRSHQQSLQQEAKEIMLSFVGRFVVLENVTRDYFSDNPDTVEQGVVGRLLENVMRPNRRNLDYNTFTITTLAGETRIYYATSKTRMRAVVSLDAPQKAVLVN